MKMKMSALVLVAALSGVPVHAAQQAKGWFILGVSAAAAVFFGESNSEPRVQASASPSSEEVRAELPARPLSPTSRKIAEAEKCKQSARDTAEQQRKAIIDAANEKIKAIMDARDKKVTQCDQNISAARQAKMDTERAVAAKLQAERYATKLEAAVRALKDRSEDQLDEVLAMLTRTVSHDRYEAKGSAVSAAAQLSAAATTPARTVTAPAPARSATPTPAARTVDVSVQGDGHTVAERVAVLDGHSS